jgi:hypothetical protein
MKCRAVVLAAVVLLSAFAAVRADEAGRNPMKSVTGTNFLVSAPSDELARAVLNRAEELRREIARDWLGKELPPSVGHTVIDVFSSQDENRGLTSPSRDLKRPTFMMWLTTSPERAMGPLLAHEVAHVVLSTRYPGQLAPWVDEGIACLYDDQERKIIRSDVLAWYNDTGNWPSLVTVLDADKIARWDQASYAVSTSVVEFLLTKGDKSQLLAFAVDGKKHGWDAALRSHYGIAGVPALERAWQDWVASDRSKSVGG